MLVPECTVEYFMEAPICSSMDSRSANHTLLAAGSGDLAMCSENAQSELPYYRPKRLLLACKSVIIFKVLQHVLITLQTLRIDFAVINCLPDRASGFAGVRAVVEFAQTGVLAQLGKTVEDLLAIFNDRREVAHARRIDKIAAAGKMIQG